MGSSVAANLILTMAPYYSEGKYLLYVSNDVVVTPRYDEILYECMESDAKIAMAAPLCNSASNLQAIPVPYSKNDLNAMLAFAKNYNHCNSRKWANRARLFQILGCYRPQVLQQMRLAFDPLFCYDMFADDDHSLALRRMGYRQVLCKDVFVHHYGSATLKGNQFPVMGLGRAQFCQKHGVDAWSSLGVDLCSILEGLSVGAGESMRVLALNPLFGESVLALRNRLRECGCSEPELDALTEDSRYLEDMEGLFHRIGMLQEQGQVLEGQYDIALVGSNLGRCTDLRAVLHTATYWLKPGGLFITQYENFFSLSNLIAALKGTLPEDGIFLHDPAENLELKVISDSALENLLKQEGMNLIKSISLVNEEWKAQAQRLLAALGMQRQETALNTILSLGKFQMWQRNS